MIPFYRAGDRPRELSTLAWGCSVRNQWLWVGGSLSLSPLSTFLLFFCPLTFCAAHPGIWYCQLLLILASSSQKPSMQHPIWRTLIQGLRTKVEKGLSLVMGCSNRANFFLFLECGEGHLAIKPCSKGMAGGPLNFTLNFFFWIRLNHFFLYRVLI